MAPSLSAVLRLTPKEQNSLGSMLKKIKSVSEFLGSALPKAHKLGFVKAIADAAPWLGVVLEAGEAFTVVKFAVTLFSKLVEERDPAQLAFLASTLAYERSIEQAVQALGWATVPHELDDRELTARLAAASKPLPPGAELNKAGTAQTPFDLDHFSFGSALLHPFVIESDTILDAYASSVGYTVDQCRILQNEVHQRFISNLKTLISHGKTKEQFDPLFRRMILGTGESAVAEALADHADYQRWLFEEKPVFGKEPFTLSQVYAESDCGVLTWGQIRNDQDQASASPFQDAPAGPLPPDPFDERAGGRQSLAQAVLERMGDPAFKDAIVVQGIAGAGKSAFTLWLSRELVRLGLRPIRVLLGDVRLDRGLSLPEALTKGIRLTDDIHCPAGLAYSPPDDLLDSSTFNQRITFGGAVICPYVLILDGWDEISISVEEGFKLRLGRMLESLRTTFLHNPHVPIRVILTGRPSTAVTESTFLLKQTPILTIRPLRPEQIEEYVSRVADRLRRPLVPLEGTGWTPFDAARFKPAIATYRTAFAKAIEGGPDQAHIEAQDEGPGDNRLDVFGLPLLLHLSVRLLSIPGVDMAATIASPTALFRGLVDLTCGKSGKAENAPEEIEHQYRLSGQRLRELLRWTAGAMTAYGQESISFEELRLRLKLAHIELAARVERDTEHNILSQLLVSYYFKGGRTHLGCEFVHKSFREYLFAEGIVEILKSFACAITVDLAERENYWQDFAPDDPRLELTRTLSPWLAPQWLSREVASHLRHLIEWEVHRGTATASPENTVGQPMAPLCIEGWMRIRDVLADLWDWWGEGVHLRPQLARDDRDNMVISPPYAQLLVEWAMPRDVGRIGSLPRPRRFTTIDSNLGDALFLLTAAVHFQLASRLGWLQPVLGASRPPLPAELWQDVSLPGQGPRRCQSEVRHQPGTPSIRFFEPFGGSPDYFRNYVARINAAGWRPLGPFPDGADLRAVDLRQVVLSITSPDPGSMITVWDYANLDGASIGGPVVRHSFRHVLARKVKMVRAQLLDVDLGFSNLKGAILFRASLVNSNLAGVDCRDAILYGADLRLSKLREADLRGANFTRALLGNADLTGALLNHANFSGADLTHATLTNASCSIINLHWKANLGATTDPPDAFIELNSRAPESPQDPEGEPIFYYL